MRIVPPDRAHGPAVVALYAQGGFVPTARRTVDGGPAAVHLHRTA